MMLTKFLLVALMASSPGDDYVASLPATLRVCILPAEVPFPAMGVAVEHCVKDISVNVDRGKVLRNEEGISIRFAVQSDDQSKYGEFLQANRNRLGALLVKDRSVHVVMIYGQDSRFIELPIESESQLVEIRGEFQ